MKRIALIAATLLVGCAVATPPGPAVPVFALLGDAPYSQPHANLFDGMIDDINRASPAFVVHLGDITGGNGPCTNEWFEARKKQFQRFASPFVLVPGDNEWTDCHRTGFDPLERLAKVRAMFNADSIPLQGFVRQSAAWPEHARWSYERMLFVTLNVPGSNNNLGRTPLMDAEHALRMRAALAWLDAAVALAVTPRYAAIVVMMQANPDFEGKHHPVGVPDGYAQLRTALKKAALAVDKPFVVAHGDTHRFRLDQPVDGAANLWRIEVDGWPQLGWLEVRVHAGAAQPIAVERHLYH